MLLKTLHHIYQTEFAKVKQLQMDAQVCKVLTDLPEPLQRYFRFCGYTGNECSRSAIIEWKNAYLRFSPQGNWKKIMCEQINVLTKPVRLVYMTRKLFGIFSFGAIDEFMSGKGQMLIKLFKFLTVSRAIGKEMDKAELVTILAETMLIPAYALQYYISWEQINSHCVKGVINYNGISASGLFEFGDSGQILSFETSDRYFTAKNGKYEKTAWVARVDSYCENGKYNIPSNFTATWKRAEGDYEYFKGTVAGVNYAPFQTYNVVPGYSPVNARHKSRPMLAFP